MTIEALQKRIAELKAEQEQLLFAVGQQLGRKQGEIAENERWLAELAPKPAAKAE